MVTIVLFRKISETPCAPFSWEFVASFRVINYETKMFLIKRIARKEGLRGGTRWRFRFAANCHADSFLQLEWNFIELQKLARELAAHFAEFDVPLRWIRFFASSVVRTFREMGQAKYYTIFIWKLSILFILFQLISVFLSGACLKKCLLRKQFNEQRSHSASTVAGETRNLMGIINIDSFKRYRFICNTVYKLFGYY